MNLSKRKITKLVKNLSDSNCKKQFRYELLEWLEQFEDDELNIIYKLLDKYVFYSNRQTNILITKLFSGFTEKFSVNLNDSIILPVYKEYGVSFSNVFFTQFWSINNLYDYCENNYNLLSENNISNIIIVDDYSGTGSTVKKSINRCLEINKELKNSKFYIVLLDVSDTALKKIERFRTDKGLDIDIYSYTVSYKAFADLLNYLYDIVEVKQKYLEICKNKGIPKDFVLGYNKTQALVSFYYNTPNNSLGLFWNEINGHKSLFKRHKKVRNNLDTIRKKCIERKKLIVESDSSEKKRDYFITYLKNNEYDLNAVCTNLGITEKVAAEYLYDLINDDIINFIDGKYVETDKSTVCSKIINSKGSVNDFNADIDYTPVKFDKTFSGYK